MTTIRNTTAFILSLGPAPTIAITLIALAGILTTGFALDIPETIIGFYARIYHFIGHTATTVTSIF